MSDYRDYTLALIEQEDGSVRAVVYGPGQAGTSDGRVGQWQIPDDEIERALYEWPDEPWVPITALAGDAVAELGLGACEPPGLPGWMDDRHPALEAVYGRPVASLAVGLAGLCVFGGDRLRVELAVTAAPPPGDGPSGPPRGWWGATVNRIG